MSTLRLGSRGPDVAKLQLLLNGALKPSPNLGMDGVFGQRTHDAVVAFQRRSGLAADGVVGPKTWQALGIKPQGASSPGPVPGAGPKWMSVAALEKGIHEDAASGKHNQRIIEYHSTTTLKATTDETPWCSSFVNWVMKQSGHTGTNNALAASWLQWGRALPAPQYGAVTVIKKKGANSDAATGSSTGNHVAFLVRSSPTHLTLLGGNQGDQVKESMFPLSAYEVRGYRWPV